MCSDCRRGVEATERSGDRVAYARNLHGLAAPFAQLGQEARAVELMRQSLAVFAELGDVAGQARLHLSLVAVVNLEKVDLDDIAEVRYHAEQALSYYEVHGAAEDMVVARYSMAKTLLLAGDHRLAIDQARSVLSAVTERSPAYAIAGLWEVLGRAHHALGEQTAAIESAHAVIDISRNMGARMGEAVALDWLGDLERDAGDLTAAHESWKLAVGILEDLHHPSAASTRAKLAGAS